MGAGRFPIGRISGSGFGVNFSGSGIPGRASVLGVDYRHPTVAELTGWRDIGVSCLRLPVKWERLQPTLAGPLNMNEVAIIRGTLDNCLALGIGVIIEVHNSCRYALVDGGTSFTLAKSTAVSAGNSAVLAGLISAGTQVVIPAGSLVDLWTRIVAAIGGHRAIFGWDLMNEPGTDMDAGIWATEAQNCITAIRATDTRNLIFIEGEGFSAARNWTTYNANLYTLTDSASKLIFSAHAWFDSTNTGEYLTAYPDGASATSGADQVKIFTDWCALHSVRGHIGEIGWPPNDSNWDTVAANALARCVTAGVSAMYWAFGGINGSSAALLADPASTQAIILLAKRSTLPRLMRST